MTTTEEISLPFIFLLVTFFLHPWELSGTGTTHNHTGIATYKTNGPRGRAVSLLLGLNPGIEHMKASMVLDFSL